MYRSSQAPLMAVVSILVLFIFGFVVVEVEAEVVQDRLSEGQARKLHFVSKFCFSTDGIGSLNIQTWNVANDTDLKLLFFDDDLWAQVHHSGLSCQQIRDKVNGVQAGQAALREGTNLTFNIAARSRPRYWYAAFSRCAPGPMRFDYQLTLLNNGDWWMQQFSVDRQGLLVAFLIFFVLYTVINLGNLFYIYTRPKTSTLYKLFALLSLLEGCAKFCFLVHFGLYADDGMGMPSLVGLGDVLDVVVILGIMGILVLVSRGWGLTSRKLAGFSTNMFIALMIFFCLYLAFFLWGDLDVDPTSTNTQYETAPGVTDLILRAVVCIFFLLGIVFIYLDKDDQYIDDTLREDTEDLPYEENRTITEDDEDEEQLLRRSRRDVADETERRTSEGESDRLSSSSAASDSESTQPRPMPDVSAIPLLAERAAARKRFFLGLAFVGAVWYLSVPFAVVLSETLPPYYRLKAVLAVSFTFNFLLIALSLLWLYPERKGLHLVNGGGVFFDLSWPTFAGRGSEWQEINEPLLTSRSAATTSRPASTQEVESWPAAQASSNPQSQSVPPTSSATTSLRTPIFGDSTNTSGREGTGTAQTLYDTL